MNIGARIAAWGCGPYDEELEYIHAGNTQWIKTDFTQDEYSSFECVYDFQYVNATGRCLQGFYSSTNAGYFGVNGSLYYEIGGNGTTILVGNRDTLSFGSIATQTTYLKINGTVQLYATGRERIGSLPLNVFAVNNGSYKTGSEKKLWSLKCYGDGEIKKDIIPVLKNGDACLYDKICGLFYYNQGTGMFGYKRYGHDPVSPI